MLGRLALPVAILIVSIFQADIVIGVPRAESHSHHQRQGHLSSRWFPFSFPSNFWDRKNGSPASAMPSTQTPTTSSSPTIISPSSPAQAVPPIASSPASTNPVSSTSPASTNSVPSSSPASTNSVPSSSTTSQNSSTSSSTAPSTPSPVVGSNTTKSSAKCPRIRIRKEWRRMSRQEQTDYTTAVKCLTVKPSKLMPGGAYRRYDDFTNVHSRMRHKVHWIAPFLPWHRHFMFLWEQALQTECGYKGNLPRWDWTLDSDDMTSSPVWSSDPQVGFGTNGKDFTKDPSHLGGGTIEDGAFANLQLYYPDEHILSRNYNLPQKFVSDGRTWGSQFFDAKAMAYVHAQTTYPGFAVALEGTDPARDEDSIHVGAHSIIHVVIGGDISPTSYAANEPLFYLHHANVDWHWATWIKANRRTRLTAYGGRSKIGSTLTNANLSDPLAYLDLGPNPTVRDTMDTTAYPYCYDYE